MTYTPGLNGGRINATIGGNTAGAGALISTGTMNLMGGNNITLSQNGQSVTISGGAGGGVGIAATGNTAGTMATLTSGTLGLAGGNNITLSQSSGANSTNISIIGPTQSVQTQSVVANVNIAGNTSGTTADVSSGALTLAGGNNITLSQVGNAISVSAPIGFAGGIMGGNTSGSSGTGTLNLALYGGNNITLSGSNFFQGRSITVSGPTMFNAGLSNIQNTAGTSGTASNQLILAGGNNITLSQGTGVNGNTITVVGPYAVLSAGISNLGNTAGTTGTQANKQIMFAGGNNVTLSQSVSTDGFGGASATVSVNASQSNQSVGLYGVSNTTQSSSATADARSLSFAGAGIASVGATNGSVVISVPAGGGAGFTAGMSNIGNTSGTSGTVNNQLVLAGGDNITLSQSTGAGGATISISAAAPGGNNDLDFYQNMDRGTSASLATAHRTLMLQRLNQENNEFGHNITANTFLLNMTANMTATSLSSSHSVTMSIGIYLDNSTALSLINSASTSWGMTAETGNTKFYHGPRWISFVSSQWSAAPYFSSGNDYVFGVLVNSSNYGPPLSYIGQNYMHSLQRSGTIGVSAATNTSLAQGNYWNAMHTATQSNLPATIASNAVNRNNATAIFMPHIVMNNRYSGTF